jgi:hypothetical protein
MRKGKTQAVLLERYDKHVGRLPSRNEERSSSWLVRAEML